MCIVYAAFCLGMVYNGVRCLLIHGKGKGGTLVTRLVVSQYAQASRRQGLLCTMECKINQHRVDQALSEEIGHIGTASRSAGAVGVEEVVLCWTWRAPRRS